MWQGVAEATSPCAGMTQSSDIPALDLVGQRFDEFRDLRQMRIDLERAAERLERAFVLAHLLQDHAESGQRPEMARLARERLGDVGERSPVVLLGEIHRRAP